MLIFNNHLYDNICMTPLLQQAQQLIALNANGSFNYRRYEVHEEIQNGKPILKKDPSTLNSVETLCHSIFAANMTHRNELPLFIKVIGPDMAPVIHPAPQITNTALWYLALKIKCDEFPQAIHILTFEKPPERKEKRPNKRIVKDLTFLRKDGLKAMLERSRKARQIQFQNHRGTINL